MSYRAFLVESPMTYDDLIHQSIELLRGKGFSVSI